MSWEADQHWASNDTGASSTTDGPGFWPRGAATISRKNDGLIDPSGEGATVRTSRLSQVDIAPRRVASRVQPGKRDRLTSGRFCGKSAPNRSAERQRGAVRGGELFSLNSRREKRIRRPIPCTMNSHKRHDWPASGLVFTAGGRSLTLVGRPGPAPRYFMLIRTQARDAPPPSGAARSGCR